MLNQIKLFFEQHLALEQPEKITEDQRRLICVALYIEMMMMDDEKDPREQNQILAIIKKSYKIDDDQAQDMLIAAERERTQATDYFQFTSLLNKQCSVEQKIQIIESLWQIAFIDGRLDEQEEYLVRKIADLLYVPHEEFIRTRNKILA
jgi:uncharacterized tellurite resistance protein B-like protein